MTEKKPLSERIANAIGAVLGASLFVLAITLCWWAVLWLAMNRPA